MLGAIDIGGTKIAAGVVDDAGRVIARRMHPTDPQRGFPDAHRRMVALLRELAAEAGSQIEGIGIGSTGPVDPLRGTIGKVSLLPGWRDAPIVAALGAEFGVPIALENDADAAALAEAAWGAGRGAECLLYVTISTGIGVGLVQRGRLYRGAGGTHPEFGHTAIDVSAGARCYCGLTGCWESLASGSALEAWHAAQGRTGGERVSAAEICRRARAGDALALSAVEREVRYLGLGLANLITSFCPDVIALGGGMMRSADLFLPPAREFALRHATQVPAHRTRIVVAELGADEVGLAGAAAAWRARFAPSPGVSGAITLPDLSTVVSSISSP